MFRYLRIAVLLTILVIVAGNQFLTGNRFSSWEKPLWVTVYPIPVEPDGNIQRYVDDLGADSFREIGDFLRQQASRHGRQIDKPIVIQLAKPLASLPPELPLEGARLSTALWSLKMRWWSWRQGGQDGLAPDDIRMFVLYQKKSINGPMERSVGIKNGSYGLVHAVASRQATARNSMIITHELMHILGASDKYDLGSGQPIAPDGLANPGQSPLYPQQRAEIMGARIATSATRWRHPASLRSCVVGTVTATEIGWL